MTAACTRGVLLPRIVPPGTTPAHDLVPGELSVGLVIEDEGGIRGVTHLDLEGWECCVEDLLPEAIANLRARSGAEGWEPVETVPGLQLYQPDGGDAASRLLLMHEIIEPWPLAGVVFAVPSPDQLLCVPIDNMQDVEAVRILVTAATYAVDSVDRPLSNQLFWFDGQKVEWLQVQADGTDGMEVLPTPAFLKALERLSALELVRDAAEA